MRNFKSIMLELERKLIQIISKTYFVIPSFKGSMRILRLIWQLLPTSKGFVRHKLGFDWQIHSRDSMWTFISSCEKFTTKIVLNHLQKIDVLVVVGANFGWYPLVAKSQRRQIEVVAFECDSQVAGMLAQNLIRNDYQVEVSHLAIADEEQNGIALYRPIRSNDGMSTLYPNRDSAVKAYIVEKVQTTTLDNYFQGRLKCKKILLIMDIEGGEFKALLGAIDFFAENEITLIVEVSKRLIEASGYSHERIFERLFNLGYQSYWIDERGFLRKVLDVRQLPHESRLPDGSGANYLFIPN